MCTGWELKGADELWARVPHIETRRSAIVTCSVIHFNRAMWDVLNTYRDEQVEEDPVLGLHARQTWILLIFTRGDTWKPLCMQLRLTAKRCFAIALWMPLRLSATTPASLSGCSGPWLGVLRRTMNVMEDILSIYYKCTLSAVTHKLNVSGHMLISTFDIWNMSRKFVRTFQLHSVYTFFQKECYHFKLL
jgi:hypothetical protein